MQDIRFSQVRYVPLGAISTLLTKKANAELLVLLQSNLFIRVAKSVDALVLRVEILEYWQHLKIYRILLERYLGDRKIDFLKKKVELLTRIQLKTVPHWLVNKNRFKKKERAGNKRGLGIMIMVKNEIEAK